MTTNNIKDLDWRLLADDFLSIKDLQHELCIGDKKWDKIFKPILDISQSVYFYGREPVEFDDHLTEAAQFLLEENSISLNKHLQLFGKVRNQHFKANRSMLASMWDYYEYPVLFFITDRNEEGKLKILIEKKISTDQIINMISGVYIAYKDVDGYVLWLRSGFNVPSIATLLALTSTGIIT